MEFKENKKGKIFNATEHYILSACILSRYREEKWSNGLYPGSL